MRAGSSIALNGTNQRTRIWTPREILLAQLYYPRGTLAATVVPFVVPTPDGRVQVNISILAVPDPGTTGIALPFDVTGGGLISAAASQRPADTRPPPVGSKGITIPVVPGSGTARIEMLTWTRPSGVGTTNGTTVRASVPPG